MSQQHILGMGEPTAVSNHNTFEMTFGEYMRSVRKAQHISLRALAKEVGKTPTYISDIENGNNRPPDKTLLDSILAALRITDNPNLCGKLYDLAALERGDIPADIKSFIIENPSIYSFLRTLQSSPNQNDLLANIASTISNGGKNNGNA